MNFEHSIYTTVTQCHLIQAFYYTIKSPFMRSHFWREKRKQKMNTFTFEKRFYSREWVKLLNSIINWAPNIHSNTFTVFKYFFSIVSMVFDTNRESTQTHTHTFHYSTSDLAAIKILEKEKKKKIQRWNETMHNFISIYK